MSWSGRFFLGATLVAVAWAAVTIARDVRIDNSVSVWFAADDPALREYRTFLHDFGAREWMLVGLEQAGSDEQRAAERDALMVRLGALEHVHAVVSADRLPLLKPDSLVPREAMLVRITNDIDREDGYRERLLAEIRSAARTLPTVVDLQVAGTPVINAELNRAARRDMLVFFPAVSALLVVLGLLVFRNVRDTLVLLSVPLGTVVITAGLLVNAGYALNMVTIMLPTVLIALSVADAVHLIHGFHANREGGDGPVAARRTVRAIAWPCAGTSATTIAGFLAFGGSSVLPLFQLAVFGSIGIALAWVLTMTVAPALMVALWRDGCGVSRRAGRTAERALRCWWRLIDRRPGTVMAGVAALSLVLAGLASLEADTDYVGFFRSSSRVPGDYRALERAGIPQNPLNLVVRVPEGESPLDPERATALAALARELPSLAGVHAVLSPFAFGDAAGDGAGFVSQDGKQAQLIAMIAYPSSKQLFGLLPQIERVAARVLPDGMTMTPTGTAYLWARMDDGVIRTQRDSLLIVSLACFVILALLFRSLRLATLGLAVSLFPVATVLGLMGLLGIPVNMATVLIAGIAVGLAVDDTIHYLHAWRDARDRGVPAWLACREAMLRVGGKIVMTTVILVGSFAVMGVSAFMPTAAFGLLSSLTMLVALAADMALLPLMLAGRRSASRQPGAAWAGSA